ncbi:hypothetical protein Nos7524_3180 [Nostoc sp. PCC 7524]|uniref:hypothetical protein n=1 Tax=Nostoc sp. (strain ATCC 29411 / PCC 7524) TaxID=28072 RepID=UPI00029EE054|nr:hypothetical protein [Nostoc sp. PCC 7524]AFY48980.1 hypothetical protein Nos7524_3180 [Nostoc sp. PCC 7524]
MVLAINNVAYLPQWNNPNTNSQERLRTFLLIQQLIETYINETKDSDVMSLNMYEDHGVGIRVYVTPDDLIESSKEAMYPLLREAGYLPPITDSDEEEEESWE